MKNNKRFTSGMLADLGEPGNLRGFSEEQLSSLAEEIRSRLIASVSRTGGHLSANLGVVELTIALHRVYESPEDKLIWDVGHQCYTHKMLTGRAEHFDTLRQQGGLSGFPKREESPHDAFNTGHSSTSISAALGMARARDLLGQKHHVVAVIGDGALTGGMALEALNDAGMSRTNLLVILNDNGMSISRNVGGLSRYLSLFRTRPAYYRTREFAERLTDRIPKGKFVRKMLRRLKKTIKSIMVPTLFFEDLGFRYFGPVDGHDINDLMKILEQMRSMQGPVLLHVRTQKGKGYPFAEEKPDVFHGMSPFQVETGTPLRVSNRTWSDWFGEAMVQLAEEVPEMVAITAAMPDGTGLIRMKTICPQRVFDVGIAEQHAVTLAAGLAAGGTRPVVALYATFLQRAYDQILHDVCLQQLPVVLAIDRAGAVGDDGETHQGIYDLSMLCVMPHLTVMAPASGPELVHMLKDAVLHTTGPVAIRYPRGAASHVPEADVPLEHGKAVLVKEGTDVAILAVGSTVPAAMAASDILRGSGISCAVLHVRYVKPFDQEAVRRLAMRTGFLLTLEDHVVPGGFGATVAQWLAEEGILCHIRNMGYPDQPLLQASREQILKEHGLHAEGVVASVLGFFKNEVLHGKKEA